MLVSTVAVTSVLRKKSYPFLPKSAGISPHFFVSHLKIGTVMGGWFVATAAGNMLVSIPGFLWGKVPLVVVWGVLVALCLISFIFIFSVMKKLEKVC